MDSKFYISLEAARLLKEKGYNEKTHAVFNLNLYGDKKSFINIVPKNYNIYEDENILSRPTKTEVIDWLDSKEIVIIVDEYYIIHEEDDYYTSCWGYYIRKEGESVYRYYSSDYKNRLEAEEAAIIKALELL
jgi:hypothetical protein